MSSFKLLIVIKSGYIGQCITTKHEQNVYILRSSESIGTALILKFLNQSSQFKGLLNLALYINNVAMM